MTMYNRFFKLLEDDFRPEKSFFEYLANDERIRYKLNTPESEATKCYIESLISNGKFIDALLAKLYVSAQNKRRRPIKIDNAESIKSPDLVSLLFLDYNIDNSKDLKNCLLNISIQKAILEEETHYWNKANQGGKSVLPLKNNTIRIIESFLQEQNISNINDNANRIYLNFEKKINGTALPPLGRSHTVFALREAICRRISDPTSGKSTELPLVSELNNEMLPVSSTNEVINSLYKFYYSGRAYYSIGNEQFMQHAWLWHYPVGNTKDYAKRSIIGSSRDNAEKWKAAGTILAEWITPQNVYESPQDGIEHPAWTFAITFVNKLEDDSCRDSNDSLVSTCMQLWYQFNHTESIMGSPDENLLRGFLAPLFTAILFSIAHGSKDIRNLNLLPESVTVSPSATEDKDQTTCPDIPNTPMAPKRFGLIVKVRRDESERIREFIPIPDPEESDETHKAALFLGRAPWEAPGIDLCDPCYPIDCADLSLSRYAFKFSYPNNDSVSVTINNQNGATICRSANRFNPEECRNNNAITLNPGDEMLFKTSKGTLVINLVEREPTAIEKVQDWMRSFERQDKLETEQVNQEAAAPEGIQTDDMPADQKIPQNRSIEERIPITIPTDSDFNLPALREVLNNFREDGLSDYARQNQDAFSAFLSSLVCEITKFVNSSRLLERNLEMWASKIEEAINEFSLEGIDNSNVREALETLENLYSIVSTQFYNREQLHNLYAEKRKAELAEIMRERERSKTDEQDAYCSR